jgi:hypothetical protein
MDEVQVVTAVIMSNIGIWVVKGLIDLFKPTQQKGDYDD